jgi:ankyrin repeat protein
VRSDSKSTPLHMAIVGNQVSVAELLLNHHADPELVDASGFNALHVAAASIGECVGVGGGQGPGGGEGGGGMRGGHPHTHSLTHSLSLPPSLPLSLPPSLSIIHTHVGAHSAVDCIYRTASPSTLKRITNARDQNGRSSQKSAPWCIPALVYLKPIQK